MQPQLENDCTGPSQGKTCWSKGSTTGAIYQSSATAAVHCYHTLVFQSARQTNQAVQPFIFFLTDLDQSIISQTIQGKKTLREGIWQVVKDHLFLYLITKGSSHLYVCDEENCI